jgi:hypothetical protein
MHNLLLVKNKFLERKFLAAFFLKLWHVIQNFAPYLLAAFIIVGTVFEFRFWQQVLSLLIF